MASSETHPLLDRMTFAEDFQELGHGATPGARVFNKLVAHAVSVDPDLRSSTALAHQEETRAGKHETVISLRSLASINDDAKFMSSIGVGQKGQAGVKELLHKHGIVNQPEAPLSLVFWYGDLTDDPTTRASMSTHGLFLDTIRSLPAVKEGPTTQALAIMRRACASRISREDEAVAIRANGITFKSPIEAGQTTIMNDLQRMGPERALLLQHLAHYVQQAESIAT